MRARPDRGRCQHDEGHQAALGRGLEGRHRAEKKSKEYPMDLSKHIAFNIREERRTRNGYNHTDWHEMDDGKHACSFGLLYHRWGRPVEPLFLATKP
eukprot:8538036-Pyramimonas_sp.AAC.1